MEKFKNIYRTDSFRLKGWNYGNDGCYFITICTQGRNHFFGEILEGKMILNELGKIAHSIWEQIPMQFEFIRLENFVVMPNHIHGILIIDKFLCNMVVGGTNSGDISRDNCTATNGSINGDKVYGSNSGDKINGSISGDPINRVSTDAAIAKQDKSIEIPNKIGGATGHHNPMLHDNISRALRWYKGRCTFEMRKINKEFGWQSLFYEHIVRNNESFHRIKTYIDNNPKNWTKPKIKS
jgi:putative transposase